MSEADDVAAAGAARPAGRVPVPARLESLAIVGLCECARTLEDLDLDALADLRLALDEAATALIRSAAPDSRLTIIVRPRENDLWISVSAPCVEDDVLRPGTFSWHVISSLTDDVETFRDGAEIDNPARVFGITMTARRLDTSR